MHEINNWVISNNILDLDALAFDLHDILRFCRARKFDVEKVKLMLSNFAQWRVDNGVDSLYETWQFPEEKALKAALPHGVHKTDKEG